MNGETLEVVMEKVKVTAQFRGGVNVKAGKLTRKELEAIVNRFARELNNRWEETNSHYRITIHMREYVGGLHLEAVLTATYEEVPLSLEEWNGWKNTATVVLKATLDELLSIISFARRQKWLEEAIEEEATSDEC